MIGTIASRFSARLSIFCKAPSASSNAVLASHQFQICLASKRRCGSRMGGSHHARTNHDRNCEGMVFGTAAVLSISAPLLLTSDVKASSLESPCGSELKSEDSSARNAWTRSCTLSWVDGRGTTKAECSVHENPILCRGQNTCNHGIDQKQTSNFDPANLKYYKIKLSSSQGTHQDSSEVKPLADDRGNAAILRNTIVVLPDLMSSQECRMIANDAERILEEKKGKNIRGCKTERWTIYSRFGKDCQAVMDRVLGEHVLAFLDVRMPDISNRILDQYSTSNGEKHFFLPQHDGSEPRSAKENVRIFWDDPVVIKYDAGNELAPHEDMRDLTIVVPLNPLDGLPVGGGGGTRFWPEGTAPEDADANGGVSVRPPAGSGVLFNGDITHSGNAVLSGTRFVLMTSITLDEEDLAEDNGGGEDTGRGPHNLELQ